MASTAGQAGALLGREYDQLAAYAVYLLRFPATWAVLALAALATIGWLLLRRRRQKDDSPQRRGETRRGRGEIEQVNERESMEITAKERQGGT